MLSLGALKYGDLGDPWVVRVVPAALAAGVLKRWPSNLISFRVYSQACCMSQHA